MFINYGKEREKTEAELGQSQEVKAWSSELRLGLTQTHVSRTQLLEPLPVVPQAAISRKLEWRADPHWNPGTLTGVSGILTVRLGA